MATKVLKVPYDPKTGALLHHPSDAVHFSHYEDPETHERLEYDNIWPPLPEPIAGPPLGRMHFRFIQTHGPQARPYRTVNTEPDWRSNEVFHACLQIDSMRSGRSAKYVIWTPVAPGPDEHRSYPMFVTDLLDVVRAGVQRGGIVCGRWIVCQRGQNFGLKVAP